MAEAHLDPRRKAEEVGARNQAVVGEVEVLHLGAEVVVECQHDRGEEEVAEEGEDSHQVEVGEGVGEEEVELLHPLAGVVEPVLQAQLALLQSVNAG